MTTSEHAAGESQHPLLPYAQARSWLCGTCNTEVRPGDVLYFVRPDTFCAQHWPGTEALQAERDGLLNQFSRGAFKGTAQYERRFEVLTAALDPVRGRVTPPRQERA